MVPQKLGFDEDEIFVIDSKRFQDGKDGSCNTDDFRKVFWTDVLKNLSLNLETLIKKVKSDGRFYGKRRESAFEE